MTSQSILSGRAIEQVPTARKDGLMHPTPVEITTAIYEELIKDDADTQTPRIPMHVMGLVRRAIIRANQGGMQ